MAGEYPHQVELLHRSLYRFKGVMEVNTGIKKLDKISSQEYQLPGKMGDLPHALLQRTQGGLLNEAWANTDVILSYDRAGWLTLEFLAWWVRECSRNGKQIQMRPLALAPESEGEIQLGHTLKFVIDHFCVLPDSSPEAMLALIGARGHNLNVAIDRYTDVLGDLLVEEPSAN